MLVTPKDRLRMHHGPDHLHKLRALATHKPQRNISVRTRNQASSRLREPCDQRPFVNFLRDRWVPPLREHSNSLFAAPDEFFNSRALQFATVMAGDRISATYSNCDYVVVGKLMSYGTDVADVFRSIRCLYRQHPQGRGAHRPTGAAVEQVRVRP